ncbi:hypothetical protein DRO30_05615 [Candidatus Bathyarchaeota archaeon]|nr:MAG: hypothetical protein DRO30_05615 [Candidatus Bathyarchaeota archaeon]
MSLQVLPFLSSSILAIIFDGYVALAGGIYLLHRYRGWGRKSYFHLLLSLGFILYSLGIFSRFWFPSFTSYQFFTLIYLALFSWATGFLFMVVGRFKISLAVVFSLIFLASLALYLLYFLGILNSVLGVLTPYLMVALLATGGMILLIRIHHFLPTSLLTGWSMLVASNILEFFNLASVEFLSMTSATAKILFLYGAANPMFAMVGVEMSKLLRTGLNVSLITRSHVSLVKCVNTSHLRELSWIKQFTTDNSKAGIKTILVILYDIISPSELKEMRMLEDKSVHVVRVLPEAEKEDVTSEEYSFLDEKDFSIIRDDLASLGLLLSSIVNYSRDKLIPCNIVIYSLSWLIHTHGWRSVYTLLTRKMPDIKNSQVHVYMFFYPEVHEDKTILSTFEKLAEEVIVI